MLAWTPAQATMCCAVFRLTRKSAVYDDVSAPGRSTRMSRDSIGYNTCETNKGYFSKPSDHGNKDLSYRLYTKSSGRAENFK